MIRRFFGWDEYPHRVRILLGAITGLLIVGILAALGPLPNPAKYGVVSIVLFFGALGAYGFALWVRDQQPDEDAEEGDEDHA